MFLSHDIGTTGTKASLYDTDGRLLKAFYHPYETTYPHQGWAEQRPENWWNAFLHSSREVLSSAKVDPGQVAGLSFSGQMMASIPVDRDGNPLTPSTMIWADHRSQPQGEHVKKVVGWERFYNDTGAGMELALYPVTKVLWIKENQPDVYEKTHKFLGVKDVLVNRLTGRFVTDFSDASNTGMFNLNKRAWATDMVRELGIDETKLVDEILPSSSVVGNINRAVSQETGLQEGTPVVLGGGDVACAALGAGVISEGSVYNYIGSASWLAMASRTPVLDTAMRPFTLCHVVPDMHVVQLAMFSAGVVYEWLRDQVCLSEIAQAKSSGRDSFDLMNEVAAAAPPGSNGILFLPDLRSGGAPHNNLGARGAFVGLTLSHKRADLIRAVLEGITYNIRLMCDAMESKVGVPLEVVRMIGGGSKSKLWREIEASILNKKVATLSAQQEANSLGAAIIAGVGLGVYRDFADAVGRFITVRETTYPKDEAVQMYNRLFPMFNEAYRSLVSVNRDLSALAL